MTTPHFTIRVNFQLDSIKNGFLDILEIIIGKVQSFLRFSPHYFGTFFKKLLFWNKSEVESVLSNVPKILENVACGC